MPASLVDTTQPHVHLRNSLEHGGPRNVCRDLAIAVALATDRSRAMTTHEMPAGVAPPSGVPLVATPGLRDAGGPQPQAAAGRVEYTDSWAVIIGINRYAAPLPKLNYAVSDAVAMARA